MMELKEETCNHKSTSKFPFDCSTISAVHVSTRSCFRSAASLLQKAHFCYNLEALPKLCGCVVFYFNINFPVYFHIFTVDAFTQAPPIRIEHEDSKVENCATFTCPWFVFGILNDAPVLPVPTGLWVDYVRLQQQ